MTTSTSSQDPQEQYSALKNRYDDMVSQGLNLDLTRGKPSSEQLEFAADMLKLPGDYSPIVDNVDLRNYGGPQGLKHLRETFGQILQVPADQLTAGGNSSLELMHNALADAMIFGTPDSDTPWMATTESSQPIFLCPTPGYDRHFAITEKYNVKMIPVALDENGPNMDEVERLVRNENVKGMWCVPQYSNPTGVTYSNETVRRLAAMKTAANDFRIFWDNAYAVHHIAPNASTKVADILGISAEYGHENRPLIFGSTSKITTAGSGVAFMGGSEENIKWFLNSNAARSIGPDKLNHLRHDLFLPNIEAVKDHMEKHAASLRPKFEVVNSILEEDLGDADFASWSTPSGGYFVNLDIKPGTANRTVELAKKAGVVLTPAGATFPYGKDPHDKNLRIAPSFPKQQELVDAMRVLTLCVKLAAVEKDIELGAQS